MAPREPTDGNIPHPDHLHGAAVVVDRRMMGGLVDRLHNGDPTVGWAGDPQMCLAYHKERRCWELWRLEGGAYGLVARSKPGKPFPGGIIQELVRRDARRGYDAGAEVDAHNAAVRKAHDDAALAAQVEAVRRAAHGVRQAEGIRNVW